MSYSDLQSFLKALEQRGQLKHVRVPVDPELEVTEIADRVMKSPCPEGDKAAPPTDPVHGGCGGHALIFDNVKGSAIPLAINTFGSYERVKLALGCESLEALADKVQKLAKPEPPTTLMEKMKALPELVKIASYPPKHVKRGMCQEVIHTDDADLFSLPIIKCWPHDGAPDRDVVVPRTKPGIHAPVAGALEMIAEAVDEATGSVTESPKPGFPVGRYITLAGIYTKSYDGKDRNVGMYRIQAIEPRRALFHCHMHHDGARHHRQWKARGERMPIAIVLGGESVLPYAATCPLPPGISELLFAGFLNGGGIELAPCRTVPLEVPANAEIVIEGFVEPERTMREGPFGDHTGYYSLADQYPVIEITAITHRKSPVYPTTIVGKPPMEDYYLGKATERVFMPLLQMIIPDLIDYHLPRFGAFHNCVFIKIRKEYPLQARKVMHAVWGAGQMGLTKVIVVVDEEVNVHNEQEVLFTLCANVDPGRDITIAQGPLDILDHAAPYCGAGSKIGIDATRKIPGEGIVRAWPKDLRMSDDVRAAVTKRWSEYGL